MLKIGLTGGIGSGKSTVAKFFEQLGVPIYSADKSAAMLQNQEPLKSQIQALFPIPVYKNQQLHRKLVAKYVFNNKALLHKLNNIVHPAVANDFTNWLSKQEGPYIIKEAAIIFEIGSEAEYDKTILVVAPEQIRINRVIERDQSNISEVSARIKNQLPDEVKKAKADYVIENINLDECKAQVISLHKELKAISKSSHKAS